MIYFEQGHRSKYYSGVSQYILFCKDKNIRAICLKNSNSCILPMLNLKSRLEDWNSILSAEIVDYWINKESESPPSARFIDLLKILNVKTDLFVELENKLLEIEKNISDKFGLEELIKIQTLFSSWYYDSLSKKIFLAYQPLKIKVKNEFEDIIGKFWLTASNSSALKFSIRVEEILIEHYKSCEKQKEALQIKENEGKKSYELLSYKIIHSRNAQERKENFDLANKALLHIYKYKFKSNLIDSKIQLIERISQSNRLILENLSQSDFFLRKLKESFVVREDRNKLLLSVLLDRMYSIQTPETIKKEIEEIMGASINRWGISSYITVEKVRELLLERVSLVTEKSYEQLVEEISSNSLEPNQKSKNDSQQKTIFLVGK